MTICPKECPDRHPGCHDHCERYREDDICEMNDVLYERYDPELVDNMTDEETRAAYNALPWKKAIFVDVHQYEEEPDAEV